MSARTDGPLDVPPHHHALVWLGCASFTALGFGIAADLDLLGPVFDLDRSRVTWLVAALTAAGSVHALWHTLACSRRVEALRAALPGTDGAGSGRGGTGEAERWVDAWLRDAGAWAGAGTGNVADPANELLDVWADRLRAPVDLGWFLVDTAVRLGLLGTIIGFVLIFTSLDSVSIEGTDGLRELLVAMSGGMGTALFTTLAGLVGATLLAVQCLILGRVTEHLLGLMMRVRRVAAPVPGPVPPPVAAPVPGVLPASAT